MRSIKLDRALQQWTQKRLCNHARPQDVTQGYVVLELKSLQLTVERVATFILKHAGLSETALIALDNEVNTVLERQIQPV